MGMNNFIFSLGGYDAEMVEIRNILLNHQQGFCDKKLSWGACLSEYKKEIENFSPDDVPIFVELNLEYPILKMWSLLTIIETGQRRIKRHPFNRWLNSWGYNST